MNSFINPPQPANPGIELFDGFRVAFITQQTGSGFIEIASKKSNPNHQVEPGHSYIVIVEQGYECRIAGNSAVRYFSPSVNADEAAEANRAVEANKDIFKNL